MIKYFYFEEHYLEDNNEYIIKNEKVLYEKPETDYTGWQFEVYKNIDKNIIDVEKFINSFGKLYDNFQDVYDKLLIEQRNKKLETL